jgi:hypothetical protein
MKTATIHEQVFLHHQCACRESHCYKIFLFQRYLSFLHPRRKAPHHRHLVTLVVFFLILHIFYSDNSLFSKNSDAFLLIFGIKYVKYLCNSCSKNPRFIFVTHICQVNDCEPIIIDLNPCGCFTH